MTKSNSVGIDVMKKIQIRFADQNDAAAMLAIYTPYIRDTAITFEYDVPSVTEFAGRIETVTAQFPWLLCEVDGQAAGYAYASRFRPRAAFQWDAEVSVYLSPAFQRMGIATALYNCLESILLAQGYRNLYALITHPHPASEGLHTSRGYRTLGVYHGTGFKFGKWHDLTVMEKQLAPLSGEPLPCKPYFALEPTFLAEECRIAVDLIQVRKS